MIEEHAIVVGVESDMATLEVVRRTACGLCGQTRGCGMSIWGRLLGHGPRVFRAVNQLDAKVGDIVVVGIEENAVLSNSTMIYGIPLAAMLAGALLSGVMPSGSVGQRDAFALVGAVLGLVIGVAWVKAFMAGGTSRSLDARYQPVILRSGDSGVSIVKCERGK